MARSPLARAQRRRKRALWLLGLPLAGAILLNEPSMFGRLYHQIVEIVGIALILACIAGRVWCSLYIGGRKNAVIVDSGPYSVVRNPLYLFSLTGMAGIGMVSGSIILGLLSAALGFVVFDMLARREEAHLRRKFGEAYERYAAAVPRWWPAPHTWRDCDEVSVRPTLILIMLRDSSLFLLALPLLEGIEALHERDLIPALTRLP